MLNFSYLILLLASICIQYFVITNRYLIGKYLKILDKPKNNKIHKSITPLVGSFSLIIFSIFLIIFFNSDGSTEDILIIFLYSYLFFIMGYIDDRCNINAYIKLLCSTIILITALIFFENFLLKDIYVDFIERRFALDKMSIFFSTLCLLLLINALNLIDGINGLASGFSSLWTLCLSLLSNGNTRTFLIIFSIFMTINTYQIIKGKYFLGDSGTLFLGSLVGLTTIYTYNNLLIANNLVSVEKIFIFFMIPGVDMFRLFLVRLINKRDPFKRDLNHMHHIMLKFCSLNTTLLIYFSLFVLTNFLSFFNFIEPIIIILIYSILYVLFILLTKENFKKTS